MSVRKAETETPESSEVRAKSAIVELDSQSKMASSDPLYEVITQQIAYLMSVITNENANNDKGQNGSRCNNGNGKFSNTKTQRPKKERKDVTCWGCRGTGHVWRECPTPWQGNNLPFKLAKQNLNCWWGRKSRPPILTQPGRSQHQWTIEESWGVYRTGLS